MKRWIVASMLCAVTAGASAQELEEISFGIISTESSQNLKQDWKPILDTLAAKTGYKVNAFFASDYAGIIEGMRFNKVQVAWFGNKLAIEAVDRANGEVFALNKTDPKRLFKVVRNANHEANALAVANKQVDVATNNSENLQKLEERSPEKFAAVWTSPLIPLDPLVMRKDLPEATKAKLRQFFYSYGQGGAQEKQALMKLSNLSGFQQSSNKQLVPIRQLELFREKTKLQADAAMPEPDKAKKLAEIDRRLAQLNEQLAQK